MMASLNTFGAILTHAINLETALRDYYQQAGKADRAKAADKRRQTMERIRRETVLEITLEPIDGLDEADYVLDLSDSSDEAQQALEASAARFYHDVAPKINVRQAQRALERAGKEHQELANQ
jgi:hypothetical protein